MLAELITIGNTTRKTLGSSPLAAAMKKNELDVYPNDQGTEIDDCYCYCYCCERGIADKGRETRPTMTRFHFEHLDLHTDTEH